MSCAAHSASSASTSTYAASEARGSASAAKRACVVSLDVYRAIGVMESSCAAEMRRAAISPRLAIRSRRIGRGRAIIYGDGLELEALWWPDVCNRVEGGLLLWTKPSIMSV